MKAKPYTQDQWKADGVMVILDKPGTTSTIATCPYHDSGGPDGIDYAVACANARIIAASPALLSAAKVLCAELITLDLENSVPSAAWDKIQDAIAKAGEEI